MPIVWIGKVEAPDKVLPNVSFSIYWREWFLVWPWKEYKMISRITKKSTGLTIDDSYILKYWWFWGYREHIIKDEIDKNEEYLIEAGYDR